MAKARSAKNFRQTPQSHAERINNLQRLSSEQERKKTNPSDAEFQELFKCSDVTLSVLSFEPIKADVVGNIYVHVTANVGRKEDTCMHAFSSFLAVLRTIHGPWQRTWSLSEQG